MSDNTNDGGYAFPAHFMSEVNGKPSMLWHGGMSLRDWFAGQVIVGLLAFPSGSGTNNYFAETAYLIADAMLVARKVVQNEDQ